MKRRFIYWSMILLAVLFVPVLSSCGDDEDELSGSSLDSYIIGTWRSYKATVTAYGETETISVSKTGDNSAMYMECEVRKGGSAVYKFWQTDANGMTHWTEEPLQYTVKGDIVTMTDSNGEAADLLFDQSSRDMIIQMNLFQDGTSYAVKLFFKK